MRQLTSVDAQFLALENARQSGHIGGLAILNFNTSPDSADAKADLVAFLKSLTDDRVRYEKAPFDHPALKIPNGHKGDNTAVQSIDGVKATDEFMTLPAVGAAGLTTPIKPFIQ